MPSTGGFIWPSRISSSSRHALNRTVRPKNADLRTREYLTEAEVERLIKAAKANRWGQRDSAMILMAFRHGLRAAELVDLRWDQVELGRNAALHVRRVKQGLPSVHPLPGDEMRALRKLKRTATSPFVFTSERGAPFTTAGFAKMIKRAGEASKLAFKAHPHMLRPRLRLCACQQGPRHTGAAGVPGPQKHSAHSAVHRAERYAV
jgi:integrase